MQPSGCLWPSTLSAMGRRWPPYVEKPGGQGEDRLLLEQGHRQPAAVGRQPEGLGKAVGSERLEHLPGCGGVAGRVEVLLDQGEMTAGVESEEDERPPVGHPARPPDRPA